MNLRENIMHKIMDYGRSIDASTKNRLNLSAKYSKLI